MRLVKQHTDVPIPSLFISYFFMVGDEEHGSISMEKAEGTSLENVWGEYNDETKAYICREIWRIVGQLRNIPRPPELLHLYQCGADGSPSIDVLLKDLQTPPRPLFDDEALRARIYERYYHFWGRLYEGTLPEMLPRSDISVFTHGDLTPRNIMVKDDHITGVIDWENAGWFPDYWEYANIMKPSRDIDWMHWMDRTKLIQWDISAINKARKVLF